MIIEYLSGDGSYDSDECIALLQEADIVVTNPPFSMFSSYMKTLFEYNKKYIIIAGVNCVFYKDIFPHIKDNTMWLGINKGGSRHGNSLAFIMDDGTETDVPAFWITNIENDRRNVPIVLSKKYSPEEYPVYLNYNAIEVPRVNDIPMDYEGNMGVPLTYIKQYCSTQFDIVGVESHLKYETDDGIKNPYLRIIIRRK